MVTPLERVVAVAQYKEPDRVPAAPLVCGASRRVYGTTYDVWSRDPAIIARSLLQAQKLIGFDGFLTLVDLAVEPAAFGQTVRYPKESTPISRGYFDDPLIAELEDYEKLEPVEPRKADRMKDIIEVDRILVNEVGKEIPVMGFLYGPAGTISGMRSLEKFILDHIYNPKPLHKALRVVTDVLVDYAAAQCETGIPALVVDVLFASGSIMGKKFYVETEGKYADKICDEAKKHNALVVLHNCGNDPYFDTMIECYKPFGISYHYLPDDCRDMAELKEKYGKKIVLFGQVDCPSTLYLGTPEDVKLECKSQIEILGPGSGLILTSGCEFPPNASLLNAVAMVDACKTYGKYPL